MLLGSETLVDTRAVPEVDESHKEKSGTGAPDAFLKLAKFRI